MATAVTIAPCLWFEDQAEPAARFYVSVFRDSQVTSVSRYGEAGREHHGRPPGTAMLVAFELAGRPFTALNGGPHFKINEAVSFMVGCDTQAEIDHYWDALSAGGDPAAQQCGWLKDQFGVSWQVVPNDLERMVTDPAASGRVMQALMGMRKLDLAALQAAYAG